jgi:hypothetical protein
MKEFLNIFCTKGRFLLKTFFRVCYIPSLICLFFVENPVDFVEKRPCGKPEAVENSSIWNAVKVL